MSDEQPRMSRREMRAKGLLAPVLSGDSSVDDLTPTAEIRLLKMTRKQLREQREAQKASEVSGENSLHAHETDVQEAAVEPGARETTGVASEEVGSASEKAEGFFSPEASSSSSHSDVSTGSSDSELSRDFDAENTENIAPDAAPVSAIDSGASEEVSQLHDVYSDGNGVENAAESVEEETAHGISSGEAPNARPSFAEVMEGGNRGEINPTQGSADSVKQGNVQRNSVFNRFDKEDSSHEPGPETLVGFEGADRDEADQGETAHQNVSDTDGRADVHTDDSSEGKSNDDGEAFAHSTDSKGSLDTQCLSEVDETGSNEGDDSEVYTHRSLKAPLLERLRQDQETLDADGENDHTHQDGLPHETVSADSVVQNADASQAQEGQESTASSASDGISSEYEDELNEIIEEEDGEKPRTWLMLIIAILVALVVGVGIGAVIRRIMSAGDVQPIMDALSAAGLPGL